MKYDEFTKSLEQWLNTDPSQRNLLAGLDFIMKFKPNAIFYAKVSKAPQRYAAVIESEIRKYYNVRLQQGTHEEVIKMSAHAEKIANKFSLATNKQEFRQGKREDHESLPADIKKCYTDNADIMKRMREVHLQLRKISCSPGICPDSDRWPFLKELIALDKQYHENWHKYDTYNANAGKSTMDLDPRASEKKLISLINLAKGRFRKNHSDTIKAQILEWYGQLANNHPKLEAELTALGIL